MAAVPAGDGVARIGVCSGFCRVPWVLPVKYKAGERFRNREEPRGEVPEDVVERPAAAVAGDPGCGCGGSCRQAGGYSGYTWFHLPDKNGMPPCPKREEASRAIFAARMAFSSLWMRLPLI